MKKRRWLFVIVAIVSLAVVAVVLNLTLRGSRYDSAIAVRAQTLRRGRLEDRVTGNGTFKPRVSVGVAAQVTGEVASVRVAEGERVAVGQLLVALRDDDYRLAREKARSSLDATKRTVAQSLVTLRAQYRSALASSEEARRASERNRELFAAKAISEEVFQRSKDAWESAQVALQSAREQLNLRAGSALDADPPLAADKDGEIIAASPEVEQAGLAVRSADDALRKCAVAAPVAGTVTMVKPSLGDVVTPATPLIRIESLEDMLAEIQIDEVDVGKLSEGLPAELSSDSLIGIALVGVVESVAPTITTLGASRASIVRVRITGAAGSVALPPLRSGASCSARIRANVREGVLLVPLAAYFTEENLSYVYLLVSTGVANRSGAEVFQLTKRQIRVGASDVSSAEVLEGLSEGDRIVAGNLKLLRDGIMVSTR